MLHPESVGADTLELLRQLQQEPCLERTRLAGGTALALQLGHRKSDDLDLFGPVPGEHLELEETLRAHGAVSLVSRSRKIQVCTVRGIKVGLVDDPFPWLAEAVVGDGLRLAACQDLEAMALAAITNRGSRRDFIDLAFLLEQFPLPAMLALYRRKYADASLFPVLKSLTYFDDADEDPMPCMLRPCDWDHAKQRIADSVSVASRAS
jgi:hypothetical protein